MTTAGVVEVMWEETQEESWEAQAWEERGRAIERMTNAPSNKVLFLTPQQCPKLSLSREPFSMVKKTNKITCTFVYFSASRSACSCHAL